jgi:Holliday junction resolvasome RuvABC endonuclease subunit
VSTIGIDPSVSRPAFALWPTARTWQFRIDGEGAPRLRDLYLNTVAWAEQEVPDDLDAVFIERPVGKFPKRALDHACGVIQAAMLAALDDRFLHLPSVFELSPGEWKKAIGLGGNAKKPDVYQWAVPRWEKPDVPAGPFTQDEADALAIACAGSALLAQGAAA